MRSAHPYVLEGSPRDQAYQAPAKDNLLILLPFRVPSLPLFRLVFLGNLLSL
jgi:hypothetical protein